METASIVVQPHTATPDATTSTAARAPLNMGRALIQSTVHHPVATARAVPNTGQATIQSMDHLQAAATPITGRRLVVLADLLMTQARMAALANPTMVQAHMAVPANPIMAQARLGSPATRAMAQVHMDLAVEVALATPRIIAQIHMNPDERRDPVLHRQNSAIRATGE